MRRWPVWIGMLLTMSLQMDPVRAQPTRETEEATTLPEVVVEEEAPAAYTRESRTDVTANASALPAPTTVLDSQYVMQSPYTGTYGDLLRQLPAVNVDNFGQGGIGYGVSIRGFTDVEHGRDVAYFIDGVPINDVSSIHYAELCRSEYLDSGNRRTPGADPWSLQRALRRFQFGGLAQHRHQAIRSIRIGVRLRRILSHRPRRGDVQPAARRGRVDRAVHGV